MASKNGAPSDNKHKKKMFRAQQMEITEYHLYSKLAQSSKEQRNRDALTQISQREFEHYQLWKDVTGVEIGPRPAELSLYYWMAKLFGTIFMMKLRDFFIWRTYTSLESVVPEATSVAKNEILRARTLRSAIDDERLRYMGAIVMGLNDAIVEITGAIAGFTFALQRTNLIALAGLITGTAGALSMASSEYLEKQSESEARNPAKAAGYTGGVYLLTAVILVAPYLWFRSYFIALVGMLLLAFIIIAFFSFYSTFLFDQKFRSRFPQMLAMSFGVALVSFLIGSLLRVALNVNA